MVRYVRQLPKQDDEADFRVEVLADKTVELEPANRYFFAGEIVRETISGCGFPRYIVSQLGPLSGTLMAIDPDEAKVKRFVGLGREPYWVRYNSRLPIVVYAPDGVEVRYRVWRASPEVAVIDKG